jgi:hypothetical protein
MYQSLLPQKEMFDSGWMEIGWDLQIMEEEWIRQ